MGDGRVGLGDILFAGTSELREDEAGLVAVQCRNDQSVITRGDNSSLSWFSEYATSVFYFTYLGLNTIFKTYFWLKFELNPDFLHILEQNYKILRLIGDFFKVIFKTK